jgi:acetyltransferase-like isoleucine patch superfamily enzyme
MSDLQADTGIGQALPTHTRVALHDYGFDIGEFSYGVPTICHWGEAATLVIGKYCSFADGIEIFLGGNHRVDWVTTYPFSAIAHWPEAANIPGHPATKGDVIIGSDVWIGSQATILSGVTVGDGAVIGTRSVVARDIPAYGVVVGNPARLIRKRFSDEIIARLLEVRWWDWNTARVRQFIPLLMQADMSKFLAACAEQENVSTGRAART